VGCVASVVCCRYTPDADTVCTRQERTGAARVIVVAVVVVVVVAAVVVVVVAAVVAAVVVVVVVVVVFGLKNLNVSLLLLLICLV